MKGDGILCGHEACVRAREFWGIVGNMLIKENIGSLDCSFSICKML